MARKCYKQEDCFLQRALHFFPFIILHINRKDCFVMPA
jgi:hypothetical protein